MLESYSDKARKTGDSKLKSKRVFGRATKPVRGVLNRPLSAPMSLDKRSVYVHCRCDELQSRLFELPPIFFKCFAARQGETQQRLGHLSAIGLRYLNITNLLQS